MSAASRLNALDLSLNELLSSAIGSVYSAAAVEVRQGGQVMYVREFGRLDPEGSPDQGTPTTRATLFDLASLTKLFTTTAFFKLVEAGHVKIDTPLIDVLPEFNGLRSIRPYPYPLNTGEQVAIVPPTDDQFDASTVSFRHLLTHSSGLPAWLNLRDAPDKASRLAMCLDTPFAYPPGTRVVYSDVGFILLGLALERLMGAPLDEVMRTQVIGPLDLDARYGVIVENVAPTEFCQWRQRRVIGEVHDENSAALGGVAGHAGLFGTARDVAILGQVYLDSAAEVASAEIVRRPAFIDPPIAQEATHRQIEDRGLGWMLRSLSGPTSSGHYFSANSYGHTGFVGTSLWVDPARELVCTLLTNNVFYGRDKDAIIKFRPLFHDTVIEALERG